jgi:peroxiredoxin
MNSSLVRISKLILIVISITAYSCTGKRHTPKPIVGPDEITKDYASFLRYQAYDVHFYEDFTGLDTAANVISKGAFLQLLSTGRYLPVKCISGDGTISYELVRLKDSVDPRIPSTIEDWGKEEYGNFQWEGKVIPDFHFTDMDGRTYDKSSTKGKIIVLKCWFVNCTACVKEMPVLNKFRRRYSKNRDVLFLSLCLDARERVDSFLKKTVFEYATIPDQEKFINQDLAVNVYPTHFVIDGEGKVVKKTSSYEEMMYVLEKLDK